MKIIILVVLVVVILVGCVLFREVMMDWLGFIVFVFGMLIFDVSFKMFMFK